MHRRFQRDLVRARLATARALARALADGRGAAARGGAAAGAPLALAAAVEGLGPRFRLVASLTNEGAAAAGGLVLALRYDRGAYAASRDQVALPLLVPLLEYRAKVRGGRAGRRVVCATCAVCLGQLLTSPTRSCRHRRRAPTQVDIRCLQPEAGAGGEVRLTVLAPNGGGGAPLLTALVRMPPSEPDDFA